MAIKFTELVREDDNTGNGDKYLNVVKGLLTVGLAEGDEFLSQKFPFEITEDMFDPEMSKWYFQFGYNSNITKMTVPEHITDIGISCTLCNNLNSVDILGPVNELEYAFDYCIGLKIANLPKAKSIYGTFSDCPNLEMVKMPQVDSWSERPFYNCTSLKLIDFRGRTKDTIPSVDEYDPFDGIPSTCKIVVPDRLYDSWITTSRWTEIASQIVKESEYVEE